MRKKVRADGNKGGREAAGGRAGERVDEPAVEPHCGGYCAVPPDLP